MILADVRLCDAEPCLTSWRYFSSVFQLRRQTYKARFYGPFFPEVIWKSAYISDKNMMQCAPRWILQLSEHGPVGNKEFVVKKMDLILRVQWHRFNKLSWVYFRWEESTPTNHTYMRVNKHILKGPPSVLCYHCQLMSSLNRSWAHIVQWKPHQFIPCPDWGMETLQVTVDSTFLNHLMFKTCIIQVKLQKCFLSPFAVENPCFQRIAWKKSFEKKQISDQSCRLTHDRSVCDFHRTSSSPGIWNIYLHSI